MKKLSICVISILLFGFLILVGEFVFPQGGSPHGWTAQDSGTDANLQGVCAVDANTAWAVGGYTNATSDYIILKTTDGGGTWTTQKSGTGYTLNDVSAIDGNVAWAVGGNYFGGSDGAILKTIDGGTTWNTQHTDSSRSFYGVCAVDANNAWVVGDNIILKTIDGGTGWTTQHTASGYSFTGVDAIDNNTAWVAGGDSILKTANGGANWTTKYTNPDIWFSGISAVDANTAWAVDGGMPDAAIVKTTDGGDTWQQQYEQYWNYNDVEAVDASNAWVVDAGLNVFKTTDGGASWIHQEHGIEYPGWGFFGISASDADNAWAVGGSGIIIHTTTGGDLHSWYFAEGCTREGFSEWLCIQNPSPKDIEVIAVYMLFGAEPIQRTYTVAACSRVSISVHEAVGPGQDVSVKLLCEDEFYAERALYFNYKQDVRGYAWDGGHATFGTRSPRSDWYFAEGCTRAGFEEWLCIQNPSSGDATVGIDYISAGAYTIHKDYNVPANSRTTVFVNGDMGPDQDVSTHVYSETPIVVERPMYFNYAAIYNPGSWTGGHIVMGTDSPRKQWYFAEGCTRAGFEEWICIQNPNPATANLAVTYATDTGPVEKGYQIPANSRGTLSINAEVGMDRDVSCYISSDRDIICERPLYFNYTGYGAPGWTGGSDELGVSSPENDWYLAEGCTEGSFQEWICIQNTGTVTATVDVTYNISGATPMARTHHVPPGRYTIYVNQDAGPDLHLSTHLSSDEPIICERSMYFDYNGWNGGHCAAGYSP